MSEPPRDLWPYFRTLDDLPAAFDWGDLFANAGPVELDIGCGRGVFLLDQALAEPSHNVLGIEIDYREGRRAARKLQKRDLQNARVIGGDCRPLLAERIPPHSVAVAHVYFPDPWWKRKHRRRRLFTDEFVGWLARVLTADGLVHSWTDVPDYFEVIRDLMDHHPLFTPLPPPAEQQPQHSMDYRTSYERKGRMAGLPIHRGCWRRAAER